MRNNDVFKRAYNSCLAIAADLRPGDDLGSENTLAADLKVSRTTVRRIVFMLVARGLVRLDGWQKQLIRRPVTDDYFPEIETESVRTLIEKRFMGMVLQRDIRPDQQINGLDLARQFSVSPSMVREYLSDFSRYGLLERRPNASWIFRGFDLSFAEELFHVRKLYELDAALSFADLADDDPIWRRLDTLERQHRDLLATFPEAFTEFSLLDENLHGLIAKVSKNRFVDQFQGIVRFIFHYHYQWRKDDELKRNAVAIGEHLTYIAALKSRDRDAIRAASCSHLNSAWISLSASIEGTLSEPR